MNALNGQEWCAVVHDCEGHYNRMLIFQFLRAAGRNGGLCWHTQFLLMGTGVVLKGENVPFWRLLGSKTTGKTCGIGTNLFRLRHFFSLPDFLFWGLLTVTPALLLWEAKLIISLISHTWEGMSLFWPKLNCRWDLFWELCYAKAGGEEKETNSCVAYSLWNAVLMVPWYSYNYLTGYAILGIITLSK